MPIRTLLLASAAIGLPLAAHAADTYAAPPAASSVVEIVVTAQKRSERLENVPISISTANREQLDVAGVHDAGDLARVVPGLHMDSSGAYSQPTIRGVGSAVAGAGLSANVATYVDGFYHPNSLTNDLEFIDVESVQVLKGPQGTLFGRNATGGAILISTLKPSQAFHGEALAQYGSFNDAKGSIYVTGGLAPTLSASLSAYYHSGDGFVKNLITGHHDARFENYAVRGQLLYRPTANLSLLLSLEHSDVNDPTQQTFGNYNGISDGALTPGTVIATKRGDVSNNKPGGNQATTDAVSLKAQYDLTWAQLTSYTQYRDDRSHLHFDVDGSPLQILSSDWHTPDRTFTQEVNLGSSGKGRVDWVVGAYYFHDNNTYPHFNVDSGGFQFDAFQTGVKTDAVAVFADVTVKISDNLFLTGGARYSHERQLESIQSTFFGLPLTVTAHSWDSFTPRGVLRYKFSDRSNVYVSVTRGFKSGAFNANGLSTIPVNPETITAYEAGYKTVAGPMRFEAAAFYYDYKNLQVNSFGAFSSNLVNAAAARIYGVEGHLAAKLTDDLTLDGGAAYTHGRYTSFPSAPDYYFDPVMGVKLRGTDSTGREMIRTPDFTGNIGLIYRRPLAGGVISLAGNFYYQSKVYFDAPNTVFQKPYGLLNLRVSWVDPSQKWEVAVYGANVTDSTYLTQVLQEAPFFGSVYGKPANVGVEVRRKF